ncbi:MAG: hypothetical protein LBN74_00290 [Prevotella sp.]|jgi:hypothetical protein|nr:hypothetical protein [Prevotella sp.]
MDERTYLIGEIGNLLELKMNEEVKNFGVTLLKNSDPSSQKYFFYSNSNNKIVPLSQKILEEIYKKFVEKFSSDDLGCLISNDGYSMYFGIAHLPTERLKKIIAKLQAD